MPSESSCWTAAPLSEGSWVEALPPRELRYHPAIVPCAGDTVTNAFRKGHQPLCTGAGPQQQRTPGLALRCFSTAERYSWQPLLPRLQAHSAHNSSHAVRHVFCATMHRHGISQISMLGDSLTRAGHTLPWPPRRCLGCVGS